MEWALIYHDGTAFTDEDGKPWKAPREGVQLAIWRDENTGWSYEQSDIGYWIWREDMGHWLGIQNEAGWWDHQFHYPGPQITVFGRTLPDRRWGEVMREVNVLLGTPKTTWRKRERLR